MCMRAAASALDGPCCPSTDPACPWAALGAWAGAPQRQRGPTGASTPGARLGLPPLAQGPSGAHWRGQRCRQPGRLEAAWIRFLQQHPSARRDVRGSVTV
ncbi:hypothetical protein NDU88_006265 [Pleurodeles waltl]|uniref:Uncharacterized protein n=1 Tax=Pleurodeles waltl TaxID=8319 RepID=A0AAV7WA35_PLEWA|nr:hypothetical protein NDU88_006265 [Pleurodeles waltl]